MAKLNNSHNDIQAQATYVTFASLGLMCCMVVTLIGIKIWWFKHRLSFDQSSTSNGAAGGSQPRVVTRSRSSKDKRLSQQFREPVVVHGIFRKREEDEMEVFERPKQLPPVRPTKLSLSRSTPSLFRPPSALKEEIDTEVLIIPAPPKYDPPMPPQPDPPAPLITAVRPTPPTTLPIKITYTLPMATPAPVPIIITTPDIQAIPTTSFETKAFKEEENTSAPNWANFTDHQTLQQQQAAITPMSENEEQLKEIEATILVHQIQSPAVELPPRRLERNLSDTSENEEYAIRRYEKAKPVFEPFKSGPNITERRVTGFQQSHEDKRQQVENGRELEEEKIMTYDAWAKYRNDLYFEDEFGKMETKSKTVQFQVEERIDQEDNESEKDCTIKERRPTGYVRKSQELLKDTELDEEDNQRKEHELWREMENDLDADFSVNVEEEFNKIRHTYEENEEKFLESPTGYGKSIDEDWENFENLENSKLSTKEKNVKDEVLPSIKARRPTGYIKEWIVNTHLENDIYKEQQKEVTFNVEYNDDMEENKSNFVKPRRLTGFVRDKVEFDEQLWTEEETTNEVAINNKSIPQANYKLDAENKEDIHNQYEEPISTLTERRPTGYVHTTEALEIHAGDAHESIIEVEHEPLRKPKPRQKVTFQFHTEPHSPPESPSDVNAEEERLSQDMPKPMQRMTKMRYTTETDSIEPTSPPKASNTAALLFSTQVSAVYAEATDDEFDSSGADGGNDSWSAIRKHRDLTEEFQQITLEGETDNVLPRIVPKAAYRNPLAQMALTTTTTSAEDAEDYVKPRTMRDMKKAQSRRVESLKFEAHAGTAEA